MLIGYTFAFIAVLCGSAKGFCGKKISGYTSNLKKAAYSNFLRMLLCIIIGFLIVLIDSGFESLNTAKGTLLISALSGVSTAIFVISWLFCVNRGAYMLVDIFLTLGVALPVSLSFFIFGEPISHFDIIGFMLLIAATFVMFSYSNKTKRRLKAVDYLLLMLSGAANGTISFSQKLLSYQGRMSEVSIFNFYTYVFASVTLGVCCLVFKIKEHGKEKKEKTPHRIYAYVSVMAVCLFAASYFSTLAAERLSAASLYPLSQGAGIILSTVMAALFFKEKITSRLILGLAIAFCGLLVLNLM